MFLLPTRFFKLFISILLYSIAFYGYTSSYGGITGKIFGKILDKASNTPIEYATVSIFKRADSVLVTGVISNDKGYFSITDLELGEYYVRINFLSYQEHLISNAHITTATPSLDLGTLFLEVDTQQLKEIVVTSESDNIDYQIDKKVITVDKQLASTSMSAVEVLENVPSINIDIDGNVLLRGSTGFIVLIDGKRTVLEPNDALRQIPASIILNIEIITNPSSKYIPDGTGGIINIITKKNRNMGISGIANARIGSFGMYGGDLLVNYRKGNSNFYVGSDLNHRPNPGTEHNERRTTRDDTITTIISNGSSNRNRSGWSIRGGWDWDITAKSVLSLQARIGNFNMIRNSNLNYMTTQNLPDLTSDEYTQSEWGVNVRFLSLNGSYVYKFSEQEELSLQVNYRTVNPDEKSESFLLNNTQDSTLNGSGITESGPSRRWDIRLDYTKPFGKDHLLEVGSQVRLGTSQDEVGIYDFDYITNKLVIQPEKRNGIDYRRDIYGIYGVFRGKFKALGYQAGIRSEYTNRYINSITTLYGTTVDRWDFFPSLHFSYDLSESTQLMANYSRRVDRPRSWYFEPFITWTDLFNVRQGDPGLLPEYIDAFESSYIKRWKKIRLSVELYYRITHNKITRVRSYYDKNVVLSSLRNVGTDYALGAEGVLNIKYIKWWEMNITGNTYNYEVTGNINGEYIENESFNWSVRMSNIFKIYKSVTLQFDSQYSSPRATSQGEERAYYIFNMGVKANFLDKKLSASLQMRDIFATAWRASLIESSTLYNYRSYLVDAPRFSINLSYRINNYRQKNKKNQGGDNDDF